MLAVEIGRAEAAGSSYAIAMVTAKHSGGRLEAAPGGPVPGGTVDCGIAFSKDRPELGKALEAALKVLVLNGTYDRVYQKWGLTADRAEPAIVQ